MTNSIGDLLRNYDLDEPPEIKRIKEYIREKFQVTAQVSFSGEQIVITVPGAALAGTLRMHTIQIQKAAETKKKLIIRIGGYK